MIISHKLECIYIKLSKVAGTSFEIALSKYCGENDIITPITEEDEIIRQFMKFHGPQNYMDSKTWKIKFRNHSIAPEIQSLISPDIWNNYLKVATIRCPYDMFISHYYDYKTNISRWKRVIRKPAFEKFIYTNNIVLDHICGLHIKGKIAADFLIRYEYLNEDIKKLEMNIGCPGLLKTFQGINAKKGFRPQTGASSYMMYSKYPDAKLMIDKRCSLNIDKYEFFRKHWPMYKAILEENLTQCSSDFTRS